MEDRQHDLLAKMVVKINEARTYNIISGILTLLWVIECFFEIFWIQKFDGFYWVIWYTDTINFDGHTIFYYNSDGSQVRINPPYNIIDHKLEK
jgi:hypothetical protein